MQLDKIATDYEKFVHDGNTIGSSIGLIGGWKQSPRWVNNGNLQEDNVLAEAAIDPCGSLSEFKARIHGIDSELLSALPQGYSLVTKATHKYTKDFLISCGRNAITFGCSSELQAWTGDDIASPSPYTELRTAGGHVHFSYLHPDPETTKDIIKMMDYLLGAWSVLHDSDTERRAMYGTAGSCRIKDYGGEYRALSNFWVDSDTLITEVYRRTELAVQRVDVLPLLLGVTDGKALREAINTYDTKECQRIETEVQAVLR